MFNLHAVQAQCGDALILEYGTQAKPRYILVDGGPADIFERHLRDALNRIVGDGGKLDLMILSHVDTDHVIGLLDLVAALRDQRANGQGELVSVGAVWHNSFARTVGRNTDIETRVAGVMQKAQA